ncbi:MAG: histidinol-phosphatase [Lentisphaeria bacterium]|nr:histidinol-phosphatase [Lentisphaeria bacterium]
MNQFVSYHNHSLWSDGKSTIAEMVDAAAKSGLAEVGLSDHFVLTPYLGSNWREWSMPLEGLDEYVREVRAAADSAGITVRLGLEIDYFPETWKKLEDYTSQHDFDYLIGSVHSADGFPIDSAASYWESLGQEQIDATWRLYLQRLREAAETRAFDFIGHLDLPKKFRFRPSFDPTPLIEAVLDAIKAADTALELNVSGWDKPCAEPYPTLDIIRKARDREIPMLLSADAHEPGRICGNFTRGAKLLREAGYTETVRFANRVRTTHPIERT